MIRGLPRTVHPFVGIFGWALLCLILLFLLSLMVW